MSADAPVSKHIKVDVGESELWGQIGLDVQPRAALLFNGLGGLFCKASAFLKFVAIPMFALMIARVSDSG